MTIYAKIEEGVIKTSEEAAVGYTGYEVNVIGQLTITRERNEEDVEETGEEEGYTETLVVKPYADYRNDIFNQIDNVYNYLIGRPKYASHTKAGKLLKEAKTLAINTVTFLKPPVTDEEEETEYIFTTVKEKKFAELKTAKKLYQGQTVVSQVNGVDKTFYGGVENAEKYKAVMDMFLDDVSEIEILVQEGFVNINRPDLMTAILLLAQQAYNGWNKEAKLIGAVMHSADEDSVNAITW